MNLDLALLAFVFGLISAASLPLGAITARFWIPKQRVVAAMMAFGAGALLSALTIDLVGEALKKGEFYPLAAGCILGGALFVVLNQLVNNKGGFLRKTATTINYLKRKRLKEFRTIFEKMSRVPLLNHLPPEEIYQLLPYITSRAYEKGRTIVRQGEPGDSLFIIEAGQVEIIDEQKGSQVIAVLGADDVFGEMALVTGEPRSATAKAASDTRVWMILKEHFDRLLQISPKLADAVRYLVQERISDLKNKEYIAPDMAEKWYSQAVKRIDEEIIIPTETEIKEAASAHGGAPLAIWLGILLDGIPESLVIGSSMLKSSISFSLLAGLFLSNYPEALSSSVGMREHDYSYKKIFWMWTSLMIITGIGAFLGNIFFVGAPLFLFALIEGIAAGAMLTMIAETMLPEAYHKGGAITGFMTLLGFLAAIFFKTLE
ncbi:cyclic nucleotide-binding domain-containing protein [Thermodesulfobacteriota bacterium]